MVSMVQFTTGHFGSVRSVHENVDSINVELETARICKTSSFITVKLQLAICRVQAPNDSGPHLEMICHVWPINSK